MAKEFKAGDVVQLKSGGPRMTVREVEEEMVETGWFAGAKHETAWFPVAVLAKADAGISIG